MSGRLERWGVACGLLTWVAVGLPVLAGHLVRPPDAGWWAAYLAYGPLLALGITPVVTGRPALARIVELTLLATGAATFALDGGHGFSSVFLVVNAAAAALAFPLRWTAALVAAQTGLVFAAQAVGDDGPTTLLPLTEAVVLAGFQAFAVAMATTALRERRARAEATALAGRLAAAQSRLADAERTAERLRIARDMHDAIGHRLTALAVHLEVATHLVSGPATEPVGRSRGLATAALDDLRDLVGSMRSPDVDLEAELTALLGSVPGLAVHLVVEPDLRAGGRTREALLRCVQEVVTNAVRHSGARNLWITLSRSDGAVAVHATDDGRGGGEGGVPAGHGLAGMRERFAQLGGEVTVRTTGGAGFTVDAVLPAPRADR